ncbi:MAG: tyrosine-type recombinase/integrase [Bacteroidetes bacterium]|nr:tyrosine-type recombinase/integrase [Bacteroidota bacterium]MBS1628706.1 tyrosine-type recombinase/integrase [Bacteroidota bacterium]
MGFESSNYRAEAGLHKDAPVIWLHFPNEARLVSELRAQVRPLWSTSKRCWYIADHPAHRRLFELPVPLIGKDVLVRIQPINQAELSRMEELLTLKAYSANTLRTYLLEFAQLLYLLGPIPAYSLTPERLRSYCLYCIRTLHLNENHMHSRINALKFYYEQVLGREKFFFEIPRPQKPYLLPKVLSNQEISRLFQATENLKHRVLLKLCYGMGLRVSEVVHLKITDIDGARRQVLLEAAKGKKDRYVNLPESILTELREYYQQYKPKYYLFEGQYGEPYSTRSAQSVFKQAMRRANINKRLGIHGLRHSYATHLLEYGTDISLIQKLLGHKDIRTTLTYTHVAGSSLQKVRSPLDRINEHP